MPRTRSGDSRPKILYSVRLACHPILSLTYTERVVWLSKTCRCRVHTLPGTPAARITFLLQEGELPIKHASWIVQVCEKQGRYDGAPRPELIIRQMPESQVKDWPIGQLLIDSTDGQHTVRVIPAEPGCEKYLADSGWSYIVDRIRSHSERHDPERCYLWHWSRYYRMIDRATAEQLAKVFAQSVDPTRIDLNEMNRLASRDLYAQAKAMGWRKLTLREQSKYGVSSQWHQQSELEKQVAERLGNPSGCGDYTIDSARGQ